MRVRLTDPAATDDLVDFLQSRADAVVELVAPGEVEASLLGSYNDDALQMELSLRIRAWEAAQRSKGVRVEIDVS